MKNTLKVFALILPFTVLATGCDNYGKRIVRGSVEVYYTDNVTEEDAMSLLTVLEVMGLTKLNQMMTVQLDKKEETFLLRMVIQQGKETDPTLINFSKSIGNALCLTVYDGAPVDVYLCDDRLNTVKVIPCTAPRKTGKKKSL